MKNNNILLTIVCVVAALAIGVLTFLYVRQSNEMAEMEELASWEKEQLENEYEELAIQFDGYQGMEVRNDSLQDLLSKEQQRVQDLLQELKVTKATNARRIAELKKELATVRAVLVQYVAQVDSLNRDNERLTAENRQFRRENTQVREQALRLKESNTVLNEVVSRASMLEVLNFSVTQLNKYDKKTRMLNHVRKLQFDYQLAKNVTATPGMKTIYVRIVSPDGELLGESEDRVFHYENADVPYTMSHELEYTGETCADSQYFAAESFAPGLYSIDFFIEGQMVGSFPFELKK